MFTKKKIGILFLIFYIPLFSFAISKKFATLQLDVTVSQIDEKTNSILSSETIFFALDNVQNSSTVPGFEDDILNWFQDDLGLSFHGYYKTSCSLQDNSITTQWQITPLKNDSNLNQIVFKVLLSSDSANKITNATMYLSDDSLSANTKITDWTFIDGNFIPTNITTNYYDENKIIKTINLKFSNIKINKPINSKSIEQKKYSTLLTNCDVPVKKEDFALPIKKYSISQPQILVNGAYSLYKKFITEQDISGCSYWPSCSSYMRQAISKYGFLGFFVGMERLERCTHTEKMRNLYPISPLGFQLDYVK